MKNKIVDFYKTHADKVVHKDVGAWLIVPMFFCELFSMWFFIWLVLAIIAPLLNEWRDKTKKEGSGWSNMDLASTYMGECKMLLLLILLSVQNK